MEEKVYGRQITKLAVAGRVVDEQQIERHFTDEEIRELYTFAPDDWKEGDERETPQLPKVSDHRWRLICVIYMLQYGLKELKSVRHTLDPLIWILLIL